MNTNNDHDQTIHIHLKPTVADCKNHLHGYIDHLVSLSEEELSEWANSEHNVPKDEV